MLAWSDEWASAAGWAAERHGKQKMLGSKLPYLLHLTEVAQTALAAAMDEDRMNLGLVVQAALLHDVVEDTPTTIEEVREEFGRDVAEAVDALSKRPEDGDADLYESCLRIRDCRLEVWLVKLADRVVNTRSAPGFWTTEKRKLYVERSEMLLAMLGPASFTLAKRLREQINSYPLTP